MFALAEKIPQTLPGKGYGWEDMTINHHKILSLYPDISTARESSRLWSYVLNWYHPDQLTIIEVPGNIEVGKILTLYGMMKMQMEIDRGYATGPGKIRPYDRSNTLKDDSIRIKFRKKGSSLVCPDYEITPEGSVICVYHCVYQEEIQDYLKTLVAKIDGYSQVKGVYRAKREVQYLIDEPEEREERINRGLIPVITPEGIVLSRVIRAEAPLCAEVA